MNLRQRIIAAAWALLLAGGSGLALAEGEPADPAAMRPRVYVPYKDIAAVLDPSAKSVLMDRAEFERLIAQAAGVVEPLELGQVTAARYVAIVRGQTVLIQGELTVRSLADGVVPVPLGFAQVGLTSVQLDGRPAPLGYDQKGRLVLVVGGRGDHKLTIEASTTLKDLPGGGMQFGMSMPAATAGTFTLVAAGDLTVHATAPIMSIKRQGEQIGGTGFPARATQPGKAVPPRATQPGKAVPPATATAGADYTAAELAIGGHDAVSVVLLGNGRQEDDRPILLGESTTAVQLGQSQQTLNCIYTVQVLRRGLAELTFTLDEGWTVTDVSCPSLVRWDVRAGAPGRPQQIIIRLRSAVRGFQAVHIQAASTLSVGGGAGLRPWQAGSTTARTGGWGPLPRVLLSQATFQRGFLLVDTGGGSPSAGVWGAPLAVRAERLVDAWRENPQAARDLPAVAELALLGDRVYYHWGADWSVELDLAQVELRRASRERQQIVLAPDQVSLLGHFEMTAVGREMFQMEFHLPPALKDWTLQWVSVNGQRDGFEYRVNDALDGARTLTVELPRPVAPEATAQVEIFLRTVPPGWDWREGAPNPPYGGLGIQPQSAPATGPAAERQRQTNLAVALIRAQADTVSGLVSAMGVEAMDVESAGAPPEPLKPVPPGRMASLGLGPEVALAYTYERAVEAGPEAGVAPALAPAPALALRVSRQEPSIAADAVGLVHVSPSRLIGQWDMTFHVSRSRVARLRVQADRRLGEAIQLEVLSHRMTGRRLLPPVGVAGVSPAGDAAETAATRAAGTQPATRAAGPCDVWELTLDAPAEGAIRVRARYELPLPGGTFDVPMVLPVAQRGAKYLAVEAGDELTVTATAVGAAEMDAIDLPPLPGSPSRIIASYRLDEEQPAPAGAGPAATASRVTLATRAHQNYDVPTALIQKLDLRTVLDAQGRQQTHARFDLVNGGLQFLTIRLPAGSQLWSAKVAGQQAKLQRSAEGDYLLAIPRTRQPAPAPDGSIPPPNSVAVEIIYSWAGPEGAAVALAAPLPVGVQVNATHWTVAPPPGCVARPGRTNMQPVSVPDAGIARRVIDRLFGRRDAMLISSMQSGSLASQGKMDQFAEDQGAVQDLPIPERSVAGEVAAGQARLQFSAGARRGDGRPLGAPQAGEKPGSGAGGGLFGDIVKDESKSMKAGHYTLPVELPHSGDWADQSTFQGLGQPELSVELVRHSTLSAWSAVGALLAALLGWLLLRRPGRTQALAVIVLLAASILAALWIPRAVALANGALLAGLALAVCLPALAVVRAIGRKIRGPARPMAAALILVAALAMAAAPAQAQDQSAAKAVALPPASGPAPLVIPYTGDPTKADQSDKVLVPYDEFLRLWNRVHPEAAIEAPAAGASVALADVRYELVVAPEGPVTLTLKASVKTFGQGQVLLPLPMANLAVREATLGGQPARLAKAATGLVLMLPPQTDAQLVLTASATPTRQGRRGSLELSLPPLPAANMTVHLGQDDLLLEAVGPDGAVTRQSAPDAADWLVPLHLASRLTLRWMPRPGGGAADRTLSAAVQHDVFAYQWALVGVSEFTFSFSAGEYDRFSLLLPESLTLTDLSAPNLRDHRVVNTVTRDGQKLSVVEARLQKPATGSFKLTVRWLGPRAADAGVAPVRAASGAAETAATRSAPAGHSVDLPLPQAGEVARESGTLVLHAAGGVSVKVIDVAGGRRSDSASPASGPATRSARPAATEEVARYYWPYRPFSVRVLIERQEAKVRARLNQLVRISPEQVQLLANIDLQAVAGQLFGADLALPDGYELLSVVGPAVSEHFLQPMPTGRRLHVSFHGGVGPQPQNTAVGGPLSGSRFSVVLVRTGSRGPAAATASAPATGPAQPGSELKVPMLTVLDPAGKPLPDQQGRLAVQVAPALDVRTVGSENLRPLPPGQLSDWLEAPQVAAVRFAYVYETPAASLDLQVRRQRTKVRLVTTVGVTIQPTAADYTYQLRYTIEGSAIDRLRFALPRELAELATVKSPALRSCSRDQAPDGKTWFTVTLINEVTGVVDVAVNFSLPLALAQVGATAQIAVPDVEAGEVESVRALVAIQNLSQHELAVQPGPKLTDLPPSQQRQWLPAAIQSSLQYAGQAFEPGWSLTLALKAGRVAQRVQAVVDLLALTTVLDKQGRVRCEATVLLQNRSEQFLRVKAPRLALWSAFVAGQPVRPALPAGPAGSARVAAVSAAEGAGETPATLAQADEVLIPLVKISPGGLPYEVRLYFGGQGAGELNGLTRLQPPSISILGVPVMRMTWTLLLPSGYRYFRPGGNVTPVAGEPELLSIELDATLEQLERFGRDDYSGKSARGQGVAAANWSKFNQKVTGKIQRLEESLESNRSVIGSYNYERLKQKLGGQSNAQTGVMGVWESNQGGLAQRDENVNSQLNILATNPGTPEVQRNQALNDLPGFVQQSAAAQEKELREQLSQLQPSGAQPEGKVMSARRPSPVLEDTKDEQVAQLLSSLQQEQQQKARQRQDELQQQVAQLKDNRLSRHFGQFADADGVAGRKLTRTLEGVQSESEVAVFGIQSGASGGGPGSGFGMSSGGRAARPAATSPASAPAKFMGTADEAAFIPQGATFSLPVALPADGVRLDFARPGGDAELTIYAVPERTASALVWTGVLAAAVLAALLLVRWASRRRWLRAALLAAGALVLLVMLMV